MDKLMKQHMEECYLSECRVVRELCKLIGYGNVMSIASVLWAKKLQDEGYSDDGAFYPTIVSNMKDTELTKNEIYNRNERIKLVRKWEKENRWIS